jgi:hypothetical protein
MEKLWLNDNNLQDEGVVYLADALKSNTNIREMYLYDNGTTDVVGATALKRTLLNTCSLNTVKESNHTCRVYYDGLLDDCEMQTCNELVFYHRQYGHDARIQCKLYLALGALSREHFNFGYLSDVNLEIFPSILHFVQKAFVIPQPVQRIAVGHCITRDLPLKNVFEVLRNCVVPLLFAPERKRGGCSLKRKRQASPTLFS